VEKCTSTYEGGADEVGCACQVPRHSVTLSHLEDSRHPVYSCVSIQHQEVVIGL
jgi:hypothetical protein